MPRRVRRSEIPYGDRFAREIGEAAIGGDRHGFWHAGVPCARFVRHVHVQVCVAERDLTDLESDGATAHFARYAEALHELGGRTGPMRARDDQRDLLVSCCSLTASGVRVPFCSTNAPTPTSPAYNVPSLGCKTTPSFARPSTGARSSRRTRRFSRRTPWSHRADRHTRSGASRTRRLCFHSPRRRCHRSERLRASARRSGCSRGDQPP